MAIPTIEQVEESGKNMDTITEEVKSSEHTLVDQYGDTRKTMAGRQADIDDAVRNAGGVPLGDGQWGIGKEYTALNQYLSFNGVPYKPLSIPYTTQGADPTQSPDLENVQPWQTLSIENISGISGYVFSNIAGCISRTVEGGQGVTLQPGDLVSIGYESSLRNGEFISGVVTSDNASVQPQELYIDITGGLYVLRLNVAGNVEFTRPESFGDTHALIKSVDEGATRVHQEPNGNINAGTTAKYDWMFDPYDSDPDNYRIFSNYTYVGDPNGTGEGAVGVINAKSIGAAWGNWPSVHFGFSDDGVSPMKMMYFDTSDTEWRTPMKGMWHEGKSVSIGDYITASNKVYKATTAGTTGVTLPSHVSGNVSDGGVDWAFDYAPDGNSVKPCMVFGDRDDMPMFNLPNHRSQFLSPLALGRGAYLDLIGDNDLLYGRWASRTGGGGGEKITEWITSDGLGRLILDATNHAFQSSGLADIVTAKVQNNTDSPNAGGTRLVRFGNTVAQDVVRFNSMIPDQVFMVDTTTTGSTFTTIKNTTGIKTASGADVVLTEFMVLTFKANFDGTRAIQING